MNWNVYHNENGWRFQISVMTRFEDEIIVKTSKYFTNEKECRKIMNKFFTKNNF